MNLVASYPGSADLRNASERVCRLMRRAIGLSICVTVLLLSVAFSPANAQSLRQGIAAFNRQDYVQAARIFTPLAERGAPSALTLSFACNAEWRLENGVSALAARPHTGAERFALLMGDHVFEPPVLERMLRLPVDDDRSLLAVDAGEVAPELAAEATKVRRDGSRIVAIGKDLDDYDALDTGLFVFSPRLYAALEDARAQGDTTLSGGVRQLAARGVMHAVEIGGATWCDIDTLSDLAAAESVLAVARTA